MKTEKKISIYQKIDIFFNNKNKALFIGSLFISIVFSFLLFNLKITTGADDSEYIVSGVKFIRGEAFPNWHGSLYQMVLGIVIAVFGVKLFILKLLSLVFIALHLIFFRKTFLKIVPLSILSIALVFIGVNSYILEYASLTYSEAMYFFVQIVCVYSFFEIIEKLDHENNILKLWREWLVLGLVTFLLFSTRTIGITMLIAIIMYFLIHKNWKAASVSLVSFMLFQIVFLIYKSIFWGSLKVGAENQLSVLLLRNPYNPDTGNVNIQDLLIRFYENFVQYTNDHILPYLGYNNNILKDFSPFVAIICAFVFVTLLILLFKRNKYLMFLGLYIIIALCATYVIVHSFWNQGRLVLVYIPFIFIFIFAGFTELLKKNNNKLLKLLPIILGCLLIILSLKSTIAKANENIPILKENLKGNKYYGYSSDWANYLKISEWSAKNLPDTARIGCRKPSMSFIYGNGRDFVGIYQGSKDYIFPIKKTHKDSLLIVNIKEIDTLLAPDEQSIMRKDIFAFLMFKKYSLGIIMLNKDNYNDIANIINHQKIKYLLGFDKIKKIVNTEKCYFIYPDSLLKILEDKKLSYLIDAKLKTGSRYGDVDIYVTTIKQYIVFLGNKYPDLFKKIKEEGDEDDVSTLYEIQWEKVKKIPANDGTLQVNKSIF
jgi:hypothetical protein